MTASTLPEAVLVWIFWVSAAVAIVLGVQTIVNFITSRSLERRAADLARRMNEDREVAYLEAILDLPEHPGRVA